MDQRDFLHKGQPPVILLKFYFYYTHAKKGFQCLFFQILPYDFVPEAFLAILHGFYNSLPFNFTLHSYTEANLKD
jgi:hypothetical protein